MGKLLHLFSTWRNKLYYVKALVEGTWQLIAQFTKKEVAITFAKKQIYDCKVEFGTREIFISRVGVE